MKTLTLQKAIEIGFDFENSEFETREELEQLVINFLHENTDKLSTREDECEVSQHGSNQSVNYKDYSCSGEIISWNFDTRIQDPETKIYHSDFLQIDEKTGEPYQMNLYCLVGENDVNTPK